jgi:hypothetical protein
MDMHKRRAHAMPFAVQLGRSKTIPAGFEPVETFYFCPETHETFIRLPAVFREMGAIEQRQLIYVWKTLLDAELRKIPENPLEPTPYGEAEIIPVSFRRKPKAWS